MTLETYFIQFGPVFITAKLTNSESSLILFTVRADVMINGTIHSFLLLSQMPGQSDTTSMAGRELALYERNCLSTNKEKR